MARQGHTASNPGQGSAQAECVTLIRADLDAEVPASLEVAAGSEQMRAEARVEEQAVAEERAMNASSVMLGNGPVFPLASAVSKGEMTATGLPLDRTSATPETMESMPRNAIKSPRSRPSTQ